MVPYPLMKIEIIAESDDSFTLNPEPLVRSIECQKFGEVWVACDGKRTSIGKTEQDAIEGVLELIKFDQFPTPVVQEQVVEEYIQPPVERGTPIENHKETNSFDFFSGTSWAGTKQGF